jgi:hypothetical protein
MFTGTVLLIRGREHTYLLYFSLEARHFVEGAIPPFHAEGGLVKLKHLAC